MLMDKNIELIRRLLDGEVSPEEEREILHQINSDSLLKEEFEGYKETIHFVENCERKTLSPSFTAEVMRRLPERKKVHKKGLRDFFLKERV